MAIPVRLGWVPALVVAGALAGCAAPARVDQMQVSTSIAVRTAIAASPLKENVAVKDVTGGGETNPMWMSKVSSSDFERALEASLRDAGLLAMGRQSGKYQLQAHMQRLDQPFAGASMTVTTVVQYTLIERSSGKEIGSRTLSTPYTAAWNAAFAGSERLKLANEGAVRENLQQLIGWLAGLDVKLVELVRP